MAMRGSATRLAGAIVLTTLVVSGCSGAKTKTLAAVATVPVAVGSSPLLAAGQQHTLAPGPNGELLAWGDNASGELGDGTGHQATGPVTVTGLDGHGRVASVDAGSTHSLAVMEDGTVFAWGHNASGQLGDGSKQDSLVPKQIEAVHDVRAVATGEGFSLVLESDGSVWAWGNNQSGELGDAKAPEDHTKPAMVYGLGPGSDVVAISAGHSFGLVLKGDGAVLGWGNDASGQLGDDTTGKQSRSRWR
jgi:alpha-tubulin suppressor-like RCC1 family protein